MNIIPKITLKTLKKHKTRTIVTIIGVILSVTMICSVMTFAETIRQNLIKDHIYENGDYFFSSENISAKKLHELETDERLEKLSAVHEIGFAEIKNGAGDKPYYHVKGANQSYFENMPIHLEEGRFPQNSNEIIVSEYIIYEAMIDLHVGDKLSLDIGNMPLDNQNAQRNDREKIKPDSRKTYTVVGIFEENEFLETGAWLSYYAFTALDSNAENFDVYCKTNSAEEISAFIDDHNLTIKSEDDMNSQLYYLGLAKDKDFGYFNINIYSLTRIPVLIIVLCSIALIYNAFSISVNERAKQFGLLASVGATKKQIRFAVLFEAFFINIIGIPVGILTGIGCVAIFMQASVSWQSILSAIVTSIITVFISAWIPSRRAAKCTAVESIRGTREIKQEKKPIKVSRLTQKLFGFEGTLGAKYFKRNRRKYRASVISLFMSIIMFISANSFVYYMDKAINTEIFDGTFDAAIYTNFDDKLDLEKLFDISKNDSLITSGEYAESVRLYIEPEKTAFLDSYKNSFDLEEIYRFNSDVMLYFINDEAYLKLLEAEKLDKAKFTNAENPLAIIYNKTLYTNWDLHKRYFEPFLNESMTELSVLTPKWVDGYSRYPKFNLNGTKYVHYENISNSHDARIVDFEKNIVRKTLNIGAYIHNPTLSTSNNNNSYDIKIIYPKSLMNAVLKDFENEKLEIDKSMYFTSPNAEELHDKLLENAEKIGINPRFIYVNSEVPDDNRSLSIIKIIAYGFIILISLIAAANVFNTISANVSLYRREFAIMKSVGMTPGSFRKMLNFECIICGLRALLFGLPVSLALDYWIYKVTESDWEVAFYIPWGAIAVAVFSVFAVVFASMIYAMQKTKNENIIDTLKNENF